MRESKRNSLGGGLIGLVITGITDLIGRSRGVELDIGMRLAIYAFSYGVGSVVGSGITYLKEEIRERRNQQKQLYMEDYIFMVGNSVLPIIPSLYYLVDKLK